MTLPIVVLQNSEKWDCHQCGVCCKSSIVQLNEQDIARLRSQKWHELPDLRNKRTMVRNFSIRASYRLAKKEDGSCVFLDDSGRCRIHSKFGADAKPQVCRVFPFQLIPRSGKAVLTIRRSCPSAAADKGAPLNQKLELANQLVRVGHMANYPIAPPHLKAGEPGEWDVIDNALKTAANLLLDKRFPPVRRLVHAAQFANLLGRAKTKSMSKTQLNELFVALEQIVPEESKSFFSERHPPGPSSNLLFRSMAFEFARLHPDYKAQSDWKQRFRMAQSFVQLTRGHGNLPRIEPCFPLARFDELERPLGLLDAEIDHALTRFIETSAASYIYAVTDRQGWTIIDSIRGLVATFPIGLWLLRWASIGREPTSKDMLPIIVALDRGYGFSQLAGPLQKRRLQILSVDGELERLVVWYAR